jgi:hypothetical protein
MNDQKKQALRRSPRFDVDAELTGHIKPTVAVKILDISEHGVRIESPAALAPAELCQVTVNAPAGTVVLSTRVARCRLKMVKHDDGSVARVYHAGLQFTDDSIESKEVKALMSEICTVKDEEPAEVAKKDTTEGKIVKAM